MIGFNLLNDNGGYNNSNIMKHAHVLKAYRRISFSEALKEAWSLSKSQQREYRAAEKEKASYEHSSINDDRGNELKAFFLSSHPDNVVYDSFWR